jgi:hypothetical protein
MTLEEAREHVGHGVVYRSGTDLAEDGVITGVDALVFVRYKGDRHAKATYPGDLTLLAGSPEPITHYLGRTEAECVAAGQTSICTGCQALGHPHGPSRKWGTYDGGRDAVTEWREELGYDPITGEVL